MTCTICGKATGPGAMLCRSCKSALKRARQLTVQDLPGAPAVVAKPGSPPGLLRAPTPAASSARTSRERSETLRRVSLMGVVIASLAAAAYIGQRAMQARESSIDATNSISAAVPSMKTPVLAVPPRLPLAPVMDVAVPSPPAPGAGIVAKSMVRSKAKPPRTTAAPAMDPPPMPQPVAVTVVAAAAVAPIATPIAPAPPDRWQLVADALARCAQDGGLSGFICDRSVRLESCDGYWGRVPQCPALREYPR